jgi:hypothetical protein
LDRQEDYEMSDDFTTPEESGNPAISQVAETIKTGARQVSDAIDTARQPGMPLDRLAARVREMPLPSLAIAFLLGIIVARRS